VKSEAARDNCDVTECSFVTGDRTRWGKTVEVARHCPLQVAAKRTRHETNILCHLQSPNVGRGFAREQAALRCADRDRHCGANRAVETSPVSALRPKAHRPQALAHVVIYCASKCNQS
jgi:hypothetical protein